MIVWYHISNYHESKRLLLPVFHSHIFHSHIHSNMLGLLSHSFRSISGVYFNQIKNFSSEKIYIKTIRNSNNDNKNSYNSDKGININEYFIERPISQHKLDILMKEQLSICHKSEISNLFRLTGKESKIHRGPLLRLHLPAIALRLKALPPTSWNYKELSFIIYGLQNYTETDNGVLDVIKFMIKVEIDKRKIPFPTFQNIAMILLGFQKFNMKIPESRQLLSKITTIIYECNEVFDAQAVGNCLYGIQGMSSECLEARKVLYALLPKIKKCNETLSSQHVGNALYGLHQMNSEFSEVRDMLSGLIPKVLNCNDSFNGQAVGNALYSFQTMSSDHLEVREMLSILTPKVRKCIEILSAQQLSNSIYGLQGMNSKHLEVKNILSVLIPKIKKCTEILNAQAVSNILYGLQGMSFECPEVGEVLSAVSPKIISCNEDFNAQQFSNSLFGIHMLLKEGDAFLLLDYLYNQVSKLATSTSKFQSLSTSDLIFLNFNTTIIIPELKNTLKNDYIKWENIQSILNDELVNRRNNGDSFFYSENLRSSTEHLNVIANKIFLNSSILISSNEYLFNLFECDLILLIPVENKSFQPDGIMINIEVDSNHDIQGRKKRFCVLRDKYLKSQGVIVKRIDLLSLQKMKEDQIKNWLFEMVAKEKANYFRKTKTWS